VRNKAFFTSFFGSSKMGLQASVGVGSELDHGIWSDSRPCSMAGMLIEGNFIP
jgi:hypothetical protein